MGIYLKFKNILNHNVCALKRDGYAYKIRVSPYLLNILDEVCGHPCFVTDKVQQFLGLLRRQSKEEVARCKVGVGVGDENVII